MVGQLYNPGDRRIDAAYTIFYMGINVGGALGPAICGAVGDTGDPADFKWSFLAAGIAMLLSVITFRWLKDHYLRRPDGTPLGTPPAEAKQGKAVLVYIGLLIMSIAMIGMLYVDAKLFPFLPYLLVLALAAIIVMIFSDKTLTTAEKKKIAVILIVVFFVIFFWAAFEQAGASLTFFADEQTNRELNLNIPIWLVTVISAGLLFLFYKAFTSARKNLQTDPQGVRVIIYLLLAAAAAYLVYLNISLMSGGQSGIFVREIPASTFQSLNSIFVVSFAPLFAFIWLKLGKYEPSSPTKMAIGLMLLAIGYLVIAFGVKDVAPGVKVTMMYLIGMYALHTWGELCLSPIGLALVNKLAPAKFASLLMAVWFLGNAFANKLAGELSALYPDGKTTVFLGYQMSNMYEFFMLFVGMAGVASLILFGLTKQLQKMMNAQ
jgi:POT family proton-dependent oligopeptide transporter